MTSSSASARYVLLAPTTVRSSAAAEPKRRFRLARLQLNQTGPPLAGASQLPRG